MRVAFQGEPGAFSEEAAERFFGAIDPLPCRDLAATFQAVRSGAAAAAMVPVENSYAGSIHEAYDRLLEHGLPVIGELTLPVRHCLLARPGTRLEDVRQVLSHPQALAQCERYLRRLGVTAVAVYDTAGSARQVAEAGEPGQAAIAGARAGERYGLVALARDIQDAPGNATRFYAVGAEGATVPPPGEWNRTVVVLALPGADRPGALVRALAAFADHGVNLLKLESRPSRQAAWQYTFHLELEAHVTEPGCAAALAELRSWATMVRVVGSFPGERPARA
jgi:prephenate dehydratase